MRSYSSPAERGIFAHRISMLSFRFAGAFLLRWGARTLSALLFHPPPRRTAWYGLALACGDFAERRHSTESNSTKYAPPQAVGIGTRGIVFCSVMPIDGVHGVDRCSYEVICYL